MSAAAKTEIAMRDGKIANTRRKDDKSAIAGETPMSLANGTDDPGEKGSFGTNLEQGEPSLQSHGGVNVCETDFKKWKNARSLTLSPLLRHSEAVSGSFSRPSELLDVVCPCSRCILRRLLGKISARWPA